MALPVVVDMAQEDGGALLAATVDWILEVHTNACACGTLLSNLREQVPELTAT